MATKAGEDPPLERLRARLASIDRSLVLLLDAREGAQWEIFALKMARSLPLLDGEREREGHRRARAWALEIGGDPELAAQVVRAARESGKRRFRRAGRTRTAGRKTGGAVRDGSPSSDRRKPRRSASMDRR